MTPKKALIIVLILFFIVVAAFVLLYINKMAADRPVGNSDNTPASTASQGELSPVEQKIKIIEDNTRQQVEQIVEQGKTATGGITVDAGNKIIEVETRELMEKLQLKTPEQLKADQQRKAELEKILQQETLQVK